MIGGLVGLFLPFVPGAFLMVAGALMLNSQCTWLSRALEKCRMRFPALERAFRRQQARTLGATDYLEKPVSSAEMNWIIKNHFGSPLKG
jgi:hypothetical protein